MSWAHLTTTVIIAINCYYNLFSFLLRSTSAAPQESYQEPNPEEIEKVKNFLMINSILYNLLTWLNWENWITLVASLLERHP